MNWLQTLIHGQTIAHDILLLSVVAALGLALGRLKIKGIGLGIAGVLFSGLLLGHFGFRVSDPVLDFAREFGLILFVYTIGMQVGPGFFASLRKQGLQLNILAATIVLSGAAITIAIAKFASVPIPAAAGLFAGATTNTPALGAVQEALKGIPNLPEATSTLPGLGYAVAYPFGIIGIILSMLLVRAVFRVNLDKENADLLKKRGTPAKLSNTTIIVTNFQVDGARLEDIAAPGSGIVISRIKHEDHVDVAHSGDVVRVGDIIHAVGPARELESLRERIGRLCPVDLRSEKSDVMMRRVIVTKKAILGRALGDLNLRGVAATRITRGDVELSAAPELHLQFGDAIILVGQEGDLDDASKVLGNSTRRLNQTQLIPMFVGIGLGVLVGSIPITIPGIPAAVKLGLAGGPLLMAILLSRIGKIGPLLWHMPSNANFAIREIGIVLFLACVGLHAGEKFFDTLVHGDGLLWMALASFITLGPLLLVGFGARVFLKMNYISLCGLLAGSMTDPPALAFANTVAKSDSPSISYAAVYPLTMLLRVVSAQLLVLIFS